MRLIELTANKDSFRSVKFNRTGLSLIVGKKTNPDDRNREHSTNGVGKSLLLYLINFCLGASKNKSFEESLVDWEFTLKYEIEDEIHIVTRSTKDQNQILFDGVSTSLAEFNKSMGLQLFQLDDPVMYLSFRSLIGVFLRQGKHAYSTFDTLIKNEKPYSSLLRSA